MTELKNDVAVEEIKVDEKATEQKVEAKKEKKPAKAKKERKPRENKLGRKMKETTSELKKVSWISFGEICKRTGIVLGFVLLTALVLLGVDTLLGLLHKLIIGG